MIALPLNPAVVQRHDQNRAFCPLQYPVDDAACKQVFENPPTVRTQNDQVYAKTFRLGQNQFDWGTFKFQLR
jgi:hypothetical protein